MINYDEYLSLPEQCQIFFSEDYADTFRGGIKVGKMSIACYEDGYCYNKSFRIERSYNESGSLSIYLATDENEKQKLKKILGGYDD